LRFLLEHKLPRRLRYARVIFEAGSAELSLSIDGSSADWHASIGRRKAEAELTDVEYARLRESVPALEMLDDDGRRVVIRNAAGYEEQWRKPRWVLTRVRKRPRSDP
jgi:hypothetical protein